MQTRPLVSLPVKLPFDRRDLSLGCGDDTSGESLRLAPKLQEHQVSLIVSDQTTTTASDQTTTTVSRQSNPVSCSVQQYSLTLTLPLCWTLTLYYMLPGCKTPQTNELITISPALPFTLISPRALFTHHVRRQEVLKVNTHTLTH